MGRMKEKFQEWQQIQEDAIQEFTDSGYSREAAENLLDRIEDLHKSVGEDLHKPGIVPKLHKEDE